MNLYLNEEEAENHLNSEINVVRKQMYGPGRPSGKENITDEQRGIIGAFAEIEGPTAASELFDVSISQASNYSKGKSHFSGEKKEEIVSVKEDKIKKVGDKALDKLLESIDAVDLNGDLKEAKLASSIAKDLSGVVEMTKPKDQAGPNIGQLVVFYPKERTLEEYGQPIEIKAEPVK